MEHERLKLHRSFLACIIYTIVGEPFKKWVDAVLEKRTQKIKSE